MFFSSQVHMNSFRLREKEQKKPFTKIGHFMIGNTQIIKGNFWEKEDLKQYLRRFKFIPKPKRL